MLRYFRLPTGHAHTVNTMVAEAYALTEPGTVGTEDPTRRDGAIDALRALNAGLPVDNDTVITLPFVWLKRVVRIPFRIPDVGPAALRPALADLKVHDLFALTRMTAAFVHTRLPEGTATLAEVRRLMDICRLLKIRGMSVDIAVALHDHTPPIKAPREVYETDQATLKAIIEAADPTMPASLLAFRPWFTLQRSARRHAPRTPTGRPPRFVGAFPAGVLAREITFWEDESTNPARRRTERVSAEIVAFLFRVQRQIAHGNARFARGDGRKAYGYFRRIWVLLGERALALGLIDPSSVEVTGPSLETILHTCGELLRKLDPADAAHARTRLSAPPERAGEGLQSLRLTDLEPSLHQEVMGALAEQPMWALGRRGLRRSLASLSDSTVGEISTSESEFTEGLATTNHMARVADLRIHDREVLVENLGAASVLQFSEKFANTWETYASSIELNDIEAVAGASLGSPAPLALEVVRGDVIEAYPSPLPESLRAFDRFFAWRPASRPDSAPRYVPVNETFSEAYRTVILPFLRDERVQDVWQFPISDFADPARFAFLLPALVARPLRNNLASTLNPSGRWDVVFDMQRGAAYELLTVETTPPDTPLRDLSSTGASSELVPCDQDLTSYLAARIKRGDRAYRLGDLERAADEYETVIAQAAHCAETRAIAAYCRPLHNHLVDQVRASRLAGIRQPVRVNDWAVENTTTGIVEPVFAGLHPSSGVTVDITERYEARIPDAQAVNFYLRDGEDRRGLGEGLQFSLPTFESEDWDGGSFQEWEEDGLEELLIQFELPEGGYPYPPDNGGIDYPPGGGTPGGTQIPVPIDVAEVERLVFHAVVHLEQIRAGLNWLGLDPDAVPPWRFDYLLSQSRYYAEKADSLQQRAMSLLQAAENTALTAQQAADTVSLTAAGVEVAKAQESLAYGQLEAASAAAEAAALAAQHTKDDVGWAGGVLAATAAGAAVGAAAGAAAGGIGAVFGAVIGAGTALISAAASTDRAVEARREAEAQVEIAEAQLSVAENQVALASEQVTLAEIQAAQAAAYLALLNAHELSSSAYYELLNIVGSFSQSYLTMATRLAFLAEKAHQIESRGYTSFISLGYGAQDSLRGRFQSGTRLLTDLDALEHARITSTVERYQTLKTTFSLLAHMPGALHLLRQTGQTVFRLDPQTLDLRFPGLYLHSLKGIEIAFDGLIPVGGVQAIVRSANNGFVRVPNDLAYIASPSLAELDWPYPEATHAIAPAAGKIQAPFVMKPLLGVGFRQILSEYRRAQDAVVVAAPEGSLGVSESLPMDLLFTVELPPTSNGFPYQNLGDARITLYFTAQFSDRLEADQRAALVAAGRVSQATVLLATAHAADSFAAFRATPLDPKRRDVRLLTLEASADRFPAHLKERVLGNFQLALIGMSGASMKVRFAGGALPITPTVDTSLASEDLPAGVPAHVPDGMVFTALGEVDQVIDGVTVYASRAGTYPALEALMDEVDDPTVAANLDNVVDTYVLKILPDNNPDHCVRDDAGVIVDTAATEASIAADGTLRHPGGEWLDVEARVLVTLAEGAFELVLRHNDPGAHNVAARLMITLSGSDLELRATIHHGATADEIAGINLPALQVLDPVYEVKLRVVGLTAQLYIDGVPLTLVQGGERVRTVALPASAPAAGSVQLGASGNAVPLLVSNVTVTRLRYDGTRLETVLDDPFDTLDGWTTAGGITLANADHRTLDVSHLLDVLLQLDYTAAFDFPV